MYISAFRQQILAVTIGICIYTAVGVLIAVWYRPSIHDTWPVFIPSMIAAAVALWYLVKKCCNYASRVYENRRWKAQKALELKLNRYTPLKTSENQIRLVAIQPGEPCHPIECNIIKYNLDAHNAVPYEALSYTWGSIFGTQAILLNEHPCEVQRNLFEALLQLRHRDRPRYMWIDALCINQFDNAERSAQVGIMRSIYQKSQQVVIWLGEADEDSRSAFRFLEDVDGRDNKEEFFLDTIGNKTYIKAWKSLRALNKRPYWHRVWIIQEIAVASSIMVQCGPDHATWHTLVTSDICWRQKEANQSLRLSQWFNAVEKEKGPMETLRILGLMPGPSILDTTRRTFSNDLPTEGATTSQTPSQNTILELIQTYWTSQSTDPKDRIYALIGLASDCDISRFKMSYDSHIVEVHMELLRYIKNTTNKIDMLGYSGIIEDSSNEGYWITADGSWLPTWTTQIPCKQQLSKINMGNRYCAAGSSLVDASIKKKSPFCWANKLHITGCVVGTVHKLGPRIDFSGWSYSKDELERVTREIQKCHTWARQAIQSIRGELPHHIARSRLDKNLSEFWRVLVCDRTIDGTWAPDDWKDKFDALVSCNSRYTSAQFRKHVRSYQLAALNCINDRQLFITTSGDFGVGPPKLSVTQTQDKDDILVFYGCNVPMARRKGWTAAPERRQSVGSPASDMNGSSSQNAQSRDVSQIKPSTNNSKDGPKGQRKKQEMVREPSKDCLTGWAYLQNYMAGEAINDIEQQATREERFALI